MIEPLTLSQIAAHCGELLNAKLMNGDASFTQVNTDTRTLVAGELFVALRGERFDAHEFLAQAADKKVCGAVVEVFDESISIPQLVVSNTQLALGQIALLNRLAFKKPVLAVTGSNGKTTVKTMLASILNQCGNVLATKGNLNNHIGVPITLLQLNAQHDYAVIEMGASAIGEIKYLCTLAQPHITMINNVMPAHIEGFGSIQGVANAKGEIYERLSANDTAVVNIDDAFSPQWLATITAKIIRVSLHNTQANCYAKNIESTPHSVSFDLHINEQQARVHINALGEHSIRNGLMAAAMAYAAGANLEQIKQGLSYFSPVAGRMNRQYGMNQALIIDDSYNANPGSVRAAIDVLATCEGRRILVLGDLAELGENAESLHAELGQYAKEKQIHYLFSLGKLSRHATEAFGAPLNEYHFDSRDVLIAALRKFANATTTLLIKGSRSANMDLVVNALCQAGDNH